MHDSCTVPWHSLAVVSLDSTQEPFLKEIIAPLLPLASSHYVTASRTMQAVCIDNQVVILELLADGTIAAAVMYFSIPILFGNFLQLFLTLPFI